MLDHSIKRKITDNKRHSIAHAVAGQLCVADIICTRSPSSRIDARKGIGNQANLFLDGQVGAYAEFN